MMQFTIEELQAFHRAIKNIQIKRYNQSEYKSAIDSLYNSIFTQEVSPEKSTYVNEEHNVRADS